MTQNGNNYMYFLEMKVLLEKPKFDLVRLTFMKKAL